jgi:hypothetical protein
MGRAVCKLRVTGECLLILFDNPTAVALASLTAACPLSGPMHDSFLKAGGVVTLLNLLSKSTCPLELGLTADLIRESLMDIASLEAPSGHTKLADAFHHSGM